VTRPAFDLPLIATPASPAPLQDAAQARNKLAHVWEDDSRVSFPRPYPNARAANPRAPSQIPRHQHRRACAGVLHLAHGGGALQEIQPGAAEAELGEPRGEAAGVRRLCGEAEGILKEQSA
jgi:hypothetical protein